MDGRAETRQEKRIGREGTGEGPAAGGEDRRRLGRGGRIAVGALAAVVVALGAMQLVLPKVAASLVREQVERYGTVRSVSVSGWPAVKLLWREADEVRVKGGSLRFQPGQAADLVSEAKGTERVTASAERATVGPVGVTDLSFQKRGGRMRGEGTIDEEAVRAALPPGVGVGLLESGGGEVKVRVSGQLFGFGASVDAVARAQDGKLVVQADAGLLGTVTQTLFEDSRVYVEGVDARELAGTAGEETRYRLTMWASLR